MVFFGESKSHLVALRLAYGVSIDWGEGYSFFCEIFLSPFLFSLKLGEFCRTVGMEKY